MSYYPSGDGSPLVRPVTLIERLKIELGHKPYADETELYIFLNENGLMPSEDYNKDTMQIQLLKTVISVLEMLSNNLDLYMKVETNFTTTSAALENLHRRIEHLKNRIKDIEDEEAYDDESGDFSFMFYTHKKPKQGG